MRGALAKTKPFASDGRLGKPPAGPKGKRQRGNAQPIGAGTGRPHRTLNEWQAPEGRLGGWKHRRISGRRRKLRRAQAVESTTSVAFFVCGRLREPWHRKLTAFRSGLLVRRRNFRERAAFLRTNIATPTAIRTALALAQRSLFANKPDLNDRMIIFSFRSGRALVSPSRPKRVRPGFVTQPYAMESDRTMTSIFSRSMPKSCQHGRRYRRWEYSWRRS
jgi:hypothetical protein